MLSSPKKDDSHCKIFLKEFSDASSTKKCEEADLAKGKEKEGEGVRSRF